MDVSEIQSFGKRLSEEIARGLVGQSSAVDLMLIALFF